MSAPPTGTVTFLFTDIEGSTRLAQQFPAALPAALARHHAILAQSIKEFDGHVFQITGDAFCAAFHQACDGLQAALNAQFALYAELWGDCVIQVRMGLHTGDATLRDGAYQNYLMLSRAQRIMSVAQGGQVLLSSTTEALLRDHLPAGVSLRAVGAVALKDFARDEQLFQAVAPGLPSDFAPPRSLRTNPNNLPVQLTSFIGREREIAEFKRLLDSTRLLALTGSGGTGKTRLSLKIAAEVLDQFQDGVWFVELAPLADPALLSQTVASVLGVREQPGRAIIDSLTDNLRDKQLLLILDNCEHLIEACARFADAALHAAPHLTILASSREALGIAGETAYRVPSLPTPSLEFSVLSTESNRLTARDAVSPSELSAQNSELTKYAAVQLFIDRAMQAQAHFRLTNANVAAVAQICYRLDGIPLAIELAAARVKVLPPEQIAARLDDRFRLLTGGSRTALPRQQTLRALIDWSHDLLTEPERVLLRRLSVFAGGWTLEAAEAVCADEVGAGPSTLRRSSEVAPAQAQHPSSVFGLPSADVLDLLTRLVDKSLVVADERNGEARYRMLETVRQYARDKLLESGEGEVLRARHLAYFVAFAERLLNFNNRLQPRQYFDAAEAEQSNLRATIEWSLESRRIASGMRLVLLLGTWYQQRYPSEGIERHSELLSKPESEEDLRLRSQTLDDAGYLQYWHGNYGEAQKLHEEALAIARAMADEGLLSHTVRHLGSVAFAHKNYAEARALLAESLELRRKNGIQYAGVLMELGEISQIEGEYDEARRQFEASVTQARIEGNLFMIPMTLRRVGQVSLETGDAQGASELIRESLILNVEINDLRAVAACLSAWAAVLASQNQFVEAVRFHAAAAVLLESNHLQLAPFDRDLTERSLTALRARTEPTVFDAAWAEGRALTLEQAVALTLSTTKKLMQGEHR